MNVSEIEGFPFSSFGEYQAAVVRGVAGLRVDTEVAIKVAAAGRFGRTPRAFVLVMLTAPWAIAICNLVYALFHDLWLLLGLLLLLLVHFLSHPAMAFVRRSLRPLMFLSAMLVGVVTAYEAYKGGHPGIVLLGGSVLAIVAANLALLSLPIKLLVRKADSEEEFFCALWESNAAILTTSDGRQFSPGDHPAPVPERREEAIRRDEGRARVRDNKFRSRDKRHFIKGEWHVPSAFGVHFNVATLEAEVGPEVILLLHESRSFLTALRSQGPYQLRLNSGITSTSAGPIIFMLWWFPPLIKGKPFAGYELLTSPKTGPSGTDLLNQAASQSHLHLVMLDDHQEIFGVVEFKNTYDFGRLVTAAEEVGALPGYNFLRAKEAFLREIPQESLL